jgi:hypothetical protein
MIGVSPIMEDGVMSLRWFAPLALFALLVPAVAHAQFKLAKGQILTYKVEQTTEVKSTVGGMMTAIASRTELTKKWDVLDVDPQGVATLRMTITALKLSQRLPSGETIAYDSTNPDASHKGLREQVGPFVGKPSVQLRLDATGKVLDAKPLVQTPVTQYDSEPPFGVILPAAALEMGKTWTRGYTIALDPPLGTGEKFDAEQSYAVRSATPGQAVIAFQTAIKNPPKVPAEAIPLLQKLPRGEAIFDTTRGLLLSIRTSGGGSVDGHMGEGSKYEYASSYQETLAE